MGVWGTIIIDGPASSNYDVDLGTFPINDWYYQDADVENVETLNSLQQGANGPAADTLLVNGTNNNGAGGAYAQVTVQAGKKHRLRLINTSVDVRRDLQRLNYRANDSTELHQSKAGRPSLHGYDCRFHPS